MSVRFTVSTRNLRGLVANLHAADAAMQSGARRTVLKYGEKQQKLTEELAPYDDSHSEHDFHLKYVVRLRFSDDALVYEVGFLEKDFTDAGLPFYAIFTEFGTRFMAARPCVFPARDAVYPEFKAALSKNVRQAIRRRKAS